MKDLHKMKVKELFENNIPSGMVGTSSVDRLKQWAKAVIKDKRDILEKHCKREYGECFCSACLARIFLIGFLMYYFEIVESDLDG